ncbi:hypothetical protein Goshw_029644 [Gossypium schwendimanii]|uniref:NB-ARC domain-containing protein n=1 Tax=Gossypium schwendimanii TaxID=34291 RepID=A0A7J9LSH2_GOSSC|nr:hypothetical protein [Gossypium schwendimanii]
MQHLRNDEVRKIGVYGMAGIRKTSVAKVVSNKLLNGVNNFNILVWVTISRKCSVIITEDKDETLRAGMLFKILSKKVVKMEPLPEADAWTLFSEKVGQNLINFVDLLPIARSIIECSAGLLLVIVIVASSMTAENSLPIWRNAFVELN